jgi:hypothetical protein
MVVWKEVEVPLPSDEQNRWDQLVGYNILDTVGQHVCACSSLQTAALDAMKLDCQRQQQ